MLIRKEIVIMAVLTAFCFLSPLAGSTVQAEPFQTTDNLTVQINWLEHNLSNARMDQVDILSPTQFAKAEEFLNKAKKRLERGDSQVKIRKELSRAQTELKEATESSRLAKAELSDVIKAREMARAAGATSYEQDYAATENRFLELTKAVEKDKITRARKHSPKVAERFRELELRAIKEQTLGEARTLIKQAETEGARKLAPKTYKAVQKKLKDVDGFITKNRYQKLKMHNMASEVLLQAGRLLQVTRQTKTIKTMKPEHIALWVEGILYDTATKLGTADMRDQPLGTQVENIMGSIDALQQDQRFLVNKVKNQQTEMEAMTEQIAFLENQTQKEKAAKKQLAKEQEAIAKRLEAERRFNQLFTKVRTYFSTEEAEVYKQGSELVIRLKAIQFPVGKDVIMPSNYSLLSKAQRAIRTFGQPNLVIEGHTDSTGSDVNNQHLSQRRAESVRAYLVANGTLPMEKIIAVGYGSKRPLASNKTAKGRAINRRIDVIIKTQPEAG